LVYCALGGVSCSFFYISFSIGKGKMLYLWICIFFLSVDHQTSAIAIVVFNFISKTRHYGNRLSLSGTIRINYQQFGQHFILYQSVINIAPL